MWVLASVLGSSRRPCVVLCRFPNRNQNQIRNVEKKNRKRWVKTEEQKKSEKPQKPLTRHIRQHMIVYKIFPLDDLVLVCVCSLKNPGEENKEKKWNVLIEITAPN